MLPRYDFGETLARLDDICQWLGGLGFTQVDRVRVYSRNIRKMTEVQARGGMKALHETMPLSEAREILWSYVDADEFVRAVTNLRDKLGDDFAAAPIENALNGPADLLLENPNNSDGRNFMFELIMAGRLAAAGFRPRFDKGPDVHVEFAGLELAIQCKRPFSLSALEKNIKRAIHQLKVGNADLNIVALSVSRILNSGDPESIPEVPHYGFVHPYSQQQLDGIAEGSKRFWFNRLSSTGILFYAFIPIRCSEGPQYFFDRCESLFPLTPSEPTITLLKSFAQALKSH